MHARLFNISGCEQFAPVVEKLLAAQANGRLYDYAYKIFHEWSKRSQVFLSAAMDACIHNIKVEASSSLNTMREKMQAQGVTDADVIADVQVFDLFYQIFTDPASNLSSQELLVWNKMFTNHLTVSSQLENSIRLKNKWSNYMWHIRLASNKENLVPASHRFNQ